MARSARIVIPGLPHHVVQRGNRKQKVFFQDDDYRFYKYLLKKECAEVGIEIWAYCLMPNHVHLILVPSEVDHLALVLSQTHRQYTRMINSRENWTGYLWQGRFQSYPMQETYLLRAVRYIELNPVRAGIVNSPEKYPWSSAGAHFDGKDDGLVIVAPVLERTENYPGFLAEGVKQETVERPAFHARTGRVLGDTEFLRELESMTGHAMIPAKRGRKPGMQFKDGYSKHHDQHINPRHGDK